MAKRYVYRILPTVLLLMVSACAKQAIPATGPVNVEITAEDFSFQSSLTTFQVGTAYHFEVTNNGKVPHEIMIMAPVETGDTDMEELDAMSLAHIEEEDLQPGQTASMDYTFTNAAPAGSLEFACHLPGHYEAGMVLPIVVK